ncbi:MAG: hypothetical protein NXI31_09100 [bacterium]|nr:hypothetical protein [bacterium]
MAALRRESPGGCGRAFGGGVFNVSAAPTTILDFPAGLGFPLATTLQSIIMDAGSAAGPGPPFSTTNAVAVVVS